MDRQFFRHEFHATLQRVLGRFVLLCVVPDGSSSDVWTSIPPPPNLCREVFDEVEAVHVQLRGLSSTQGLENCPSELSSLHRPCLASSACARSPLPSHLSMMWTVEAESKSVAEGLPGANGRYPPQCWATIKTSKRACPQPLLCWVSLGANSQTLCCGTVELWWSA